ncbi:MAG TPA: class I SAM-dependent methyltransferase [Polyangiaceae bacterium]|nr:class I SAM-dependent methyltransferase [Polyangiaceae bacterium]
MTALFLPPSMRHFVPKRPGTSLSGRHLALEYDLVEALRPRLLVDVGAGDATSFFTLCQSMKEHDVDGSAYALDVWEQPEPADQGIFGALSAYARQTYPGIHYLMRMPLAAGLRHFGEGTVDLVRLDAGRVATGEAGSVGDWAARVRPGGVLLLHGTAEPPADLPEGTGVRFADAPGLLLHRRAGGSPPEAELLRLLFVEGEGPALERLYRHIRQHRELRVLLSRLA